MSTEPDRETGAIRIEIAYATPEKQVILSLKVSPGTTVEQAIAKSAIREEFPAMKKVPAGVGIFSRKVALDHILRQGDRIEIYRPLIADPKEVRRERAKKEAGKL
jgi:putative ubiquitin-RnfH superfamily antitoxin RatB of RatAB toxin-antitoxin module